MVDDLNERMAGIERQNRTLRFCVIALGLAFVGSWGWQSVRPAQSQAKQQVVVGDDGITLLRKDGTKAAEWKIYDVGDAMLHFYDGSSKEIFYVGGNGHNPAMVFRNKKDDATLSMGVDERGEASILFGGNNNNVIAALSIYEGDPSLSLIDKDDKMEVRLGFLGGKPEMKIVRKDGTVVWGMPDQLP